MRLIDADELLRLSHRFHISEFDRDGVEIIYADTVRNAPTVETQKTGKWMREVLTSGYGTTVMYQCTNCEKMSISKYKFCPNCGIRMKCK